MKAAAQKTYGRKGQDVVEKNWKAIDAGAQNVVKVDVPDSWGQAEGEEYDISVASGDRQDVVEIVRTSLISSTTSSPRSTVRKVTRFLYLLFPHTMKAPLLPALLHLRSAVSQSTFPYGQLTTASSAHSALMYALTLQSVLWL